MTDTMQHANENAKGWLASIEDMLERRNASGQPASDDSDDEIHQSVLSVQVRSGWYSPGVGHGTGSPTTPEEYEILLSTGGPALRIIGRLDDYCEPTSAEMQAQDWGTPWTRYPAPEATLLDFARCFWFGE